jgi:plasmid stabilization system protein ParE
MGVPTYRLTNQALADLEDISDYLGERSPSAAIRVLNELERTFKALALNPVMGAQRDDLHVGLRMFCPKAGK